MSENACAQSNRERMETAVEAWIQIAATRPDGKSWARAKAEWLNDQMTYLVSEPTPRHLTGLNAFDLANARDRMMGAAV